MTDRIYMEMVRSGNMTEGDATVAYAMLTALTRFGIDAKTLVTQLAQLITPEAVPAVEAEVKNILEKMMEER